jgi:hypothetical protein
VGGAAVLLGQPQFDLVGKVSGYALTSEDDEQVLRFRVTTSETGKIEAPTKVLAVEMRGTKIYGILDDGDEVALVRPLGNMNGDQTLRPLVLRNLTTGGELRVWRPALRRRALRAGLGSVKEAWKALIGALVGGAVLFIFRGGAASTPGPGNKPAGPMYYLVAESGVIVLAAAVWYLYFYRHWRRAGGALPVARPLLSTILVAWIVALFINVWLVQPV